MRQDTFTFNGREFSIRIERDDSGEAPWEHCDGHGIISDWTRREKNPGERVLCEDRQLRRYYDVSATMKLAKRDGWDAEPYGGTAGERAARAVEADFQRMRAWCNDEWFYAYVVVALLDKNGNETEYTDSLGMVESDYAEQCAREEMAPELLAQERADKRAASKEKRERAYWNSRDVETRA